MKKEKKYRQIISAEPCQSSDINSPTISTWHLRNQQNQKGHSYLPSHDLHVIGVLSILWAEMSQHTKKSLLESSQLRLDHTFGPPITRIYAKCKSIQLSKPRTFQSSFLQVPMSLKTYIEEVHFFLFDLYFVIGMSVMQRVRKRFFSLPDRFDVQTKI